MSEEVYKVNLCVLQVKSCLTYLRSGLLTLHDVLSWLRPQSSISMSVPSSHRTGTLEPIQSKRQTWTKELGLRLLYSEKYKESDFLTFLVYSGIYTTKIDKYQERNSIFFILASVYKFMQCSLKPRFTIHESRLERWLNEYKEETRHSGVVTLFLRSNLLKIQRRD